MGQDNLLLCYCYWCERIKHIYAMNPGKVETLITSLIWQPSPLLKNDDIIKSNKKVVQFLNIYHYV